jgi:putative lipoprotein (rSAM/lipoprotein system)
VITDDDPTDQEYEDNMLYGCPSVTYHVEGIVNDNKGAPIEGIEVKASIEYYDPISTKTGVTGEFVLDTTTDQCQEPASVDVEARDVDGSDNGGYQTKIVAVPLVCSGYDELRQCSNTDVKIELEEAIPDDDTLLKD